MIRRYDPADEDVITCGECGAKIHNTLCGQLYNRFHRTFCTFFASGS